MPFLLPNQQRQITEGNWSVIKDNNITSETYKTLNYWLYGDLWLLNSVNDNPGDTGHAVLANQSVWMWMMGRRRGRDARHDQLHAITLTVVQLPQQSHHTLVTLQHSNNTRTWPTAVSLTADVTENTNTWFRHFHVGGASQLPRCNFLLEFDSYWVM